MRRGGQRRRLGKGNGIKFICARIAALDRSKRMPVYCTLNRACSNNTKLENVPADAGALMSQQKTARAARARACAGLYVYAALAERIVSYYYLSAAYSTRPVNGMRRGKNEPAKGESTPLSSGSKLGDNESSLIKQRQRQQQTRRIHYTP